MSRATTWLEEAGVPSVAVICSGFEKAARLVARAGGLPAMRLLEYPLPNIGAQTRDEIYVSSLPLVDQLVSHLTHSPSNETASTKSAVARPRAIVFKGTLEDVNDHFQERVWSDGLPVVPPTLDRVDAFLAHTDRSPEEVIGLLPPTRLPATVWKVAVNGVMAGCRPEYMPVLLAIAEAIADPAFGLENVGSTVGMTPLIILNGPIARQLGFNAGQGVLRPQARANITVSRFLRLLMVNVAGYRLGEADMATFGRNYYPVLAEAEDDSPWTPLSVDRGFAAGTNLVTVMGVDSITHNFLTHDPAENHLRVHRARDHAGARRQLAGRDGALRRPDHAGAWPHAAGVGHSRESRLLEGRRAALDLRARADPRETVRRAACPHRSWVQPPRVSEPWQPGRALRPERRPRTPGTGTARRR